MPGCLRRPRARVKTTARVPVPVVEGVRRSEPAQPATRRPRRWGIIPLGDRGGAMKQLSGLDTTFLNVETGPQYGHVAGLCIFARPDTPGYEPYAAWRGQLEERLHLLEPLRRRLAEVPMGLDNPYWIEDPDFDLDFHVRHSAVPPPGRDDQLVEVVSRIVARPLDRARPLWLSYVIEGLSDDRFAVLTLFHHASIDGASGAELFSIMLDARVEGSDIAPPDRPWRPDQAPSGLDLMARGMVRLSLRPARAIYLGARAARELGKATRNPVLASFADQAWQTMGLLGP